MCKNNILTYLNSHRSKDGNKAAFIYLKDGESEKLRLSYEELFVRTQILGSYFLENNYEGKHVMMVYTDVMDFIITFLACQYAGVIPIPIASKKGNRHLSELTGIINDSGCDIVFSTESGRLVEFNNYQPEFARLNNVEVLYTDIIEQSLQSRSKYSECQYNHTAFIQYTSGSTEAPKGVVISQTNLLNNQQLIKQAFACTPESIICSWLPFHHDMGLIGNILHTIFIGCTCVLLSPSDFIQRPLRWLKAISDYKVTHSGGPNFAYDFCTEKISEEQLASLDLSSWKYAYNGSEIINYDTIISFSNHFRSAQFNIGSFYGCYGLAEATLLVSGKREKSQPVVVYLKKEDLNHGNVVVTDDVDEHGKCLVSSGVVLSGLSLKIISERTWQECGITEVGEICIAGDSVTQGYWNRNNKSTFHIIDGKKYLRTGDLGFLRGNELFITGRLKEMIILRGLNIYPSDIEQAICLNFRELESHGVAAFNPDTDVDHLVVLAEVRRMLLNKTDAEELINRINSLITSSSGLQPLDILLLTPFSIPRTTSGKIQRLKCKKLYKENQFRPVASKLSIISKQRPIKNELLADRVLKQRDFDSIECYLFHMIRYKLPLFSLDNIDADLDLMELGFDSLRLMELINEINIDLNINLVVAKVIQMDKIATLIKHIENVLWLKNDVVSDGEIII